ncbi:TlpA disulfide reductase family protein [Halalkalibaculum sp. DA384]|uniref:TlpA disulfide reductase family protein n=1 Tax=Halalkalibaculum sp. DA384 TaxID=3373606 RepID=UPI0037549F7F
MKFLFSHKEKNQYAARNPQYASAITYSVLRSFPKLLLALLALPLLLSCSSGDSSKSKPTEPLERLDPTSAALYPARQKATANDFTVTLMNGDPFQLSGQKGKVVLMNIWATWCAPCADEMPDFVDLYEEYRDEGLVILGVSIDEQGRSVVKPFMEKFNVTYPMFIDDGTIMEKYGPTMGIPTTYIIDKQGDLRYFSVGALTKKELEPRLKELLAKNAEA